MDITPIEKDVVLAFLTSRNAFEFPFHTDYIPANSNASPDAFNLTIEQLADLGFLDVKQSFGRQYWIKLKASFFDFVRRGGFQGQEEVFRNGVEKLLLEIENLKKQLGPNNLETVNKLASIGNALIAGFSLFK